MVLFVTNRTHVYIYTNAHASTKSPQQQRASPENCACDKGNYMFLKISIKKYIFFQIIHIFEFRI